MPIDYSDPRPAYQQIADELREMIKDGRIQIGDRLQSRKELAERYGVAPETVRKAQNELAQEGLISTHSTRGIYVIKTPEDTPPSPEFQMVMAELHRLAARIDALEHRMSGLEGD
ncbi:GntR family transcriptional regulator [Nonomuraea rubra]|uniref:GntR family transcriptional regulator n=1 Tax=Nonomuraea rubra TaxID=46180 RepID=UPI0033C369BF